MPNEVAMFDIVWDESLSNLHIGYETNLITIADMIDMGYNDISVTAPTGCLWKGKSSRPRSIAILRHFPTQ